MGIDLIDSSAIISCAYPHLYHFPNWFLIVSLVGADHSLGASRSNSQFAII